MPDIPEKLHEDTVSTAYGLLVNICTVFHMNPAVALFFHGTTNPQWARPHHCRGFTITNTHTHTNSVGLLWTSDETVAKSSTWQHNTHNRHPCRRRDSNPQLQQAIGCRTTPETARAVGSAVICALGIVNIQKFRWRVLVYLYFCPFYPPLIDLPNTQYFLSCGMLQCCKSPRQCGSKHKLRIEQRASLKSFWTTVNDVSLLDMRNCLNRRWQELRIWRHRHYVLIKKDEI